MAKIIETPAVIKAAGTGEKIIREFFGLVNSGTKTVSIAQMISPEGWSEPGQTPDFDEYTLVLKGSIKVETREGEMIVSAGQAIVTYNGEWTRYSTPFQGGAEYIAVCVPAFSPDLVHREG